MELALIELDNLPEMSLRRSPISTLVVAVCVGFMVYVAMYSHLDGRTKEMRRAFSSRSLMNHANANANAGNAAATTSDIISNAGVISAIDQIITSVGMNIKPPFFFFLLCSIVTMSCIIICKLNQLK